MTRLPTDSEFAKLLEKAATYARPDELEIMLTAGREGLTRFSGNAISQNVMESSVGLTVKVVAGDRIGRVSGNQSDPASVKAAVESARTLARASRPSPQRLPLVGPQTYARVDGYRRETARQSPAERADLVAAATRGLAKQRLDGAGIYETRERFLGFGSSAGACASGRTTEAIMSITARTSDGGSGWAEAIDASVKAIDPLLLSAIAADKAKRSRKPRALRPGRYTVILEPAAVVELMLFLSSLGFGALSYLEGRSPLAGRLGKRVFAAGVTIADDAYHPLLCGVPFDFEGLPRKAVRLVDDGVFTGLVHDRRTAAAMGVPSTGHSLPQPNSDGPLPFDIVMLPGEATLEEMIAGTDKGILVTQFHYTNVLDPSHLVLTGMTRNGTFLVERGRITRPLKNLRFTESVIRALGNVEAVGKELVAQQAFFGATYALPALKIRDFNFSSATEF